LLKKNRFNTSFIKLIIYTKIFSPYKRLILNSKRINMKELVLRALKFFEFFECYFIRHHLAINLMRRYLLQKEKFDSKKNIKDFVSRNKNKRILSLIFILIMIICQINSIISVANCECFLNVNRFWEIFNKFFIQLFIGRYNNGKRIISCQPIPIHKRKT
jgi:hypothetical protein